MIGWFKSVFGAEDEGLTHTMSDGTVMSGATHTPQAITSSKLPAVLIIAGAVGLAVLKAKRVI